MPTSTDHRARTERYSTTALILLIGLVVQALITIYTNPDRSLIEGAFDTKMPTIDYQEESAVSSSPQREDPSTIQNKFLVGYQGWFTCGGDGEPIDRGHHGWLHWVDKPLKDGGRITFELWPDTSELDEDELYDLPGLSIPAPNGSSRPAKVFSSRNAKTVNRHYRWMRDHQISGAFLQRFLGEVKNGDNGMRRYRDEVVERVRDAANQNGRVWSIMYDISGVPDPEVEEAIKADYLHLMNDRKIFQDPMYLREAGRPVIAIWGMGMKHEKHDPVSLVRLLRWIKEASAESAYIFAGCPSHWRTRDGDCDANPAFDQVWQNVDSMSPWYVGRFGTIEGAGDFKQRMAADMAYLQDQDRSLNIKRYYTPVVFPGFAWQNLHSGPRNEIPREGGTFLYQQLHNAINVGAKTIYGAMFDEYDEATALMPAEPHSSNTPSEIPFLALDEDGMELPSDWYLRICGLASKALKSGEGLPGAFPLQALMEKQPPAVLTSGISELKLHEGDSNGPSLVSNIEAVLRDLPPPARLSTTDRFSNEYEEIVDQYKFTSLQQLRLLTSELNGEMGANTLSDELVFRLWFTLLRLAGPGALQSDEGRRLSQDCLARLPQSERTLIRLLSDGVKPAFAGNPHPQLDSGTGRKLAVIAGGERARHELFEDQVWKSAPSWGIYNVLEGCLARLSAASLTENLGLVLPPLLTIMDDYETTYRDHGLRCLETLLDKVNATTLKRMGIDKLFLKCTP
ncbi:hypothetical protein HD553DRAFT_62746 [Filobasidium floriforme]|uniref:uncharacterized protein n=1 Tax=Filobasidium floriforme TaxID=5210 RepID=UPI001E8CA9CF|nr:uncharacterized protein HD553DRAFT_62746 [Filobasidium floriforme]KAH8082638.1 hypothetical protein HD553DRAFT_62746 [Filobasidium floriforme]